MKTTSGKIYRFSILSLPFLFIASLVASSSAQTLQIDSVSVDSVWNSDSSWNDDQGILQNRESRDCKISFITRGTGTVQCFALITLDSAKTWTEVTKLSDQLFSCGSKSTIIVRVSGGDKSDVAFKITGRQYKPVIKGNPQIIRYSNVPDKDPVPGSAATVPVKLLLANDTSSSGYAAITKVYWDTLGDGSWDDSTTSLTWTWNTMVPLDTLVKKKTIIAKVRDGNGFWSKPETLTVQFGLKQVVLFEGFEGNLESAGFQKIYSPPAYGWLSTTTKAARSGLFSLTSDSNNTGIRKWLDEPIRDSIAGLEFYLIAKSMGHTNFYAALAQMGMSSGMLGNGFYNLMGMGINKSDSLWFTYEQYDNPQTDTNLIHKNFAALELNKWYKCKLEYDFTLKKLTYSLNDSVVFTKTASHVVKLDMFFTIRDSLGAQGPKDYFIDDVTAYKR